MTTRGTNLRQTMLTRGKDKPTALTIFYYLLAIFPDTRMTYEARYEEILCRLAGPVRDHLLFV